MALRQTSHGFWAVPTLQALVAMFSDFFPYALFPLAAIMIWTALLRPRKKALLLPRCSRMSGLAGFLG